MTGFYEQKPTKAKRRKAPTAILEHAHLLPDHLHPHEHDHEHDHGCPALWPASSAMTL